LCSNVAFFYLQALAPTVNFQGGDLARLPIPDVSEEVKSSIVSNALNNIEISRDDWNSYETSWNFTRIPLLESSKEQSLSASFANWNLKCDANIQAVKKYEEDNNKHFIEVSRLSDTVNSHVPEDQVALARADRDEDTKRLISYAIGCMMGRYSLTEEGLIYANSGNKGFDLSRYGNFPADDDGIVPITDTEWFDDDATVRFEEFLKIAWSPETLKENLKFIGDSLANNGGNDPLKTIRNYLSKSFYKDHLKTYKKRPIYWLFSSGKERAFECLVYLHRYNGGTLARMRMEYVTPLQSRMSARIDQLGGDVDSAPSSAERTRKQKEKDKLVKQLEELRSFDEELRHFADQRIDLDLDDGVKVNYVKFGSLLPETKIVTGEK
jgi:type II restriction/modification system DNA methylase subunit YeeA